MRVTAFITMKFLPLTLAALYINSADAIGGTICGPILTAISSAFDAALPIDAKPDCGCAAKADSFLEWVTLQFYFKVECSAQLCVDDLKDVPGMADVIDNLPLAEGSSVCIRPTAGAKINPLNKRETHACSGASQIVLDVPKLEEVTKKEVSDQPTITFPIPDVCFTLEHKATLAELKKCKATIDGKNCPCDVCADGAGIQLNCPTIFDDYLPEELDNVLGQTTNCISANMLSNGDEPPNTFFSFFDLVKPNPMP